MLDKIELSDVPESYQDLAEAIGIDGFRKLVKFAGGTSVYVPVESCVIREYRNKILKKSFKGDYKGLAKTYRISEGHLRRILR